MGSDGGGGSVQQIPGGPIRDVPLQDNLANAGLNMLTQSLPYAHAGAGYQLLPRVPLGQVYMPGPNPTTMGDPFNAQYAQSYFGPNSGHAPPGYGGSSGGGWGSGSSGGQQGGFSLPFGPPQQQGGGLGSSIAGGSQTPGLPGGAQPHPMVSLLTELLKPGALGQLFAQAGQQQPPQNPQGGGNSGFAQPQQQQQQGGGR